MMIKSSLRRSAIGGLAAILMACAGAPALLVAEGGISGTGISFGTILGFASVIVNGSKLEVTSQTEIYIDEQPASENELKVGQVIRVSADFDELTAQRIDYMETVRGPIVASPNINPDTLNGQLTVLDQVIKTNSATVFSNITDLLALAVNDVVDISGVRDADGSIVARFIELKSPPVNEYRVIGRIENLNSANQTFVIGGLTIDFSAASIAVARLANDVEVRIRGAAAGYSQASQLLAASEVKDSLLSLNVGTDDSLEVEGVVTGFTSLAELEVNGLQINASQAVVENGVAADIKLNSLIEFEGVIDDQGVLQASNAKIVPLNSIRIEAAVDSVDLENKTLTILGVTFNVTQKTQLEDKSSLAIKKFSLADIAAPAWLEVRGYVQDGQLFAARVERDEADTDVRLQGPVDAFDAGSKTLSILGVAIGAGIDTEYEDVNDQRIQESVFFNSLTAGDLVKARWKDFTSTALAMDELSFEE